MLTNNFKVTLNTANFFLKKKKNSLAAITYLSLIYSMSTYGTKVNDPIR